MPTKTMIEMLFDASSFKGYGKCSTFGGPADTGVKSDEGLALDAPHDAEDVRSPLWHLFLGTQPPGTIGTARRLNPRAFYCACRWQYSRTSKLILRRSLCIVVNARAQRLAICIPADWGPNARTGRVIDLSPGAAAYLQVGTDDNVAFALWTPSFEIPSGALET